MTRRGVITGARLGMALAGAALAILSIAVARRSPGFSFAGESGWAAAVELAAGWSLLVAAIVFVAAAGRRVFAILLFAAAMSWFVVELNNPGIGSSPAFTAGLVFYTVCPVVVAHAALRWAGPLDLPSWIAVGAGYLATVGLGGIGPALAFDPGQEGCSECPANLLVIADAPGVAERMTRVSVYAGIAWVALLGGALARALARSSAARRSLLAPVLVATIGYLCLVGLDYVYSVGRGFRGNDAVDRRLWVAQGAVLVAVVLGTAWPFVRRRVTRTAVARLVVDAAAVPAAGGLSNTLGEALGDRSLRVLYPLADGRMADSAGKLAEPDPGRSLTRLTRDDVTVALLEHRPGLLDEDSTTAEIVDAARLALDNERLQCERRLQLEDLRASRARIVAAGDAERRRLERDLHDGAQQKLVALALSFQLAQLKSTDPATASRLGDARAEVARALAELRSVAHGLYPVELADEGLTAALETLRESAAMRFAVTSTVDGRLPEHVESAAYFAVLQCLAGATAVSIGRVDGTLRVDVETCERPRDLAPVEDRVGALGGSVAIKPGEGTSSRIRVELPCGS